MKNLFAILLIEFAVTALELRPAQAATNAYNRPQSATHASAMNVDGTSLGSSEKAQLPLRLRRRRLITGEASFHRVAGYAATLGYQFTRDLAVDIGVGFEAPKSAKIGLRVRIDLAHGVMSPFITLGAGYYLAGKNDVLAAPMPQLEPWMTASALGGFSAIHHSGLTLLVGAGIMTNLATQLGSASQLGQKAAPRAIMKDINIKSGPVVSVAVGYAF